MPDVYDDKMALFENFNPEEFLLFLRKPETTIKASVAMSPAGKSNNGARCYTGDPFESLRHFWDRLVTPPTKF